MNIVFSGYNAERTSLENRLIQDLPAEMKDLYFCCICLTNNHLRLIYDEDSDGVTNYEKLTSSIVEMNFKEMNDQRFICIDCCSTLNIVYNFRQTCLRSKANLITRLSQSQTSSHVTVTSNDPSDVKPELVVVKEERVEENEERNGFEESNLRNDFQTESYKKYIHLASVKEECESEEDVSSAHEDATVDPMSEIARSDIKVEDVGNRPMTEDEQYVEFSKIEVKEYPLAEGKEEAMSDSYTQDGSTSQAATGTSGEPMESRETTIGNKLAQNSGNGTEKLKCEICEKRFTHKGSLTNHMRKHSGERPFECDICKRSFKHKSNLTYHMHVHSGEELYECEICNKSFNVENNLIAHKKLHSDVLIPENTRKYVGQKQYSKKTYSKKC